MSRIESSPHLAVPPHAEPHTRRLLAFRILAVIASLFFLIAVTVNAPAPWVLLQPGSEPHPELHRWFFTVGGAVDAIVAGCLLGLVLRPRRVVLFADVALAIVVAGAIILPFTPSFLAILAVAVIPVLVYPYWRDALSFARSWRHLNRPLAVLAGLAGAVLVVTAGLALSKQIVGTDLAAQAGWWADYAEHATILAMAGMLAATQAPGWRILTGLCSGVWMYLGVVALIFLPDQVGSWGRFGASAAVLVGLGFAAAWYAGRHSDRMAVR